jgi:PAS domain S-box-containing protein
MAGFLDAPPSGQPEIDHLFRDPAFREFRERGSPALAVSVADRSVAWANEAARSTFGAKLDTLPSRLIGGGADAGMTPRLRRILVESGAGMSALSFLTKRVMLADGGEVLVSALLGAPPAASAAEPVPEPIGAAGEAAPDAAPLDAPEIGTTPAPPLTAQDVRAQLLKSHRNPTVRFLWQTDETGRVTSVTPPLGEIVGGANADLVGCQLADIVRRLRLDPTGKLLAAMQVPETWSGIEVPWPIVGAAAAVPVDLGGFPVFDGERGFRGFRGFGVIHLDRIREGELVEANSQRDAAPCIGEEPAHEVEEQPATAAVPQEAGAAPREAEADAAVQPAPIVAAANVVPLRPFATLAAVFGFRPSPAEIPAPPVEYSSAATGGRSLSDSEHQAFEEIARQVTEESALDPPEVAAIATPLQPNDGAIALLDRLPLGVLISRNEAPVYANRTLLELTGYSSVEHLQVAGGVAGLFEGPREAATDAGTTSVRTLHGDLVRVESKLQAISWEGQPASLVTLRRASDSPHFAEVESLELELRHRDAETGELRAILDTATDGVAILDAEGRILSLNRSAEALFGFQQNEVAGEPFTMLIAPESRRVVEDYLARLQTGGVAKSFNGGPFNGGPFDRGREVSGFARQGGTLPIFLTLGRIGADGRPSKLCAVIRDTSAPRRAEQEAREAREEAERASAIKSDFLAKVSHEIRTPLNAIIGFAEVIMDERLGPIGTERYKDYLRDIHKSGTHVMSLVNDLLDLSKIEAGKMVLDIKPVDANVVITECVALMQPQANRERVIMRLALASRLAQIAADERSLRQIVLNLLSNAVKYNEPGGQVIVSTAMSDTGHAVIRVKDTGIGMSEAEVAVALEPFRQVATARPVSGTGLGLPLTKALIEANRASFAIRSRKNEGTLVEVSFPPARVLAESA